MKDASAGGDDVHVGSQGGQFDLRPHSPSLQLRRLVVGPGPVVLGFETVHHLQVHPVPLPTPIVLSPQPLLYLHLYRVVYVLPELLSRTRPLEFHLQRPTPVLISPLARLSYVASVYHHLSVHSVLGLLATPHLPHRNRNSFVSSSVGRTVRSVKIALTAVVGLQLLVIFFSEIVTQNLGHESLLLFLALAQQQNLLVELGVFGIGLIRVTVQVRTVLVNCQIAGSFVEVHFVLSGCLQHLVNLFLTFFLIFILLHNTLITLNNIFIFFLFLSYNNNTIFLVHLFLFIFAVPSFLF